MVITSNMYMYIICILYNMYMFKAYNIHIHNCIYIYTYPGVDIVKDTSILAMMSFEPWTGNRFLRHQKSPSFTIKNVVEHGPIIGTILKWWIYIYIYIYKSISYTCVYIYKSISYTCVYIYKSISYTCVYIYIYLYHTHVYIYKSISYTCVYIYINLYHTHVYIIYIYTWMKIV